MTDRLLNNKIAVVTGGATGIGKEIVRGLAENGSKVISADRNIALGEQESKQFQSNNLDVEFMQLDISKSNEVKTFFEDINKKFQKLDILVNNAGIYIKTGKVTETSEFEWDLSIATNLTGTFLCCKYGIPLMEDSGGSIINLSSGSGIRGTYNAIAYGVTKAGIIHLTKTISLEFATKNIRVNCIVPGLIDTQQSRGSTGSKEAFEKWEKGIPMQRAGKPEEIAPMVVFLCSTQASYITGSHFEINGGSLA
jgi:NAD(P)-dependent dehydrogenase (short-subunit alcohol dehydrogenase family)